MLRARRAPQEALLGFAVGALLGLSGHLAALLARGAAGADDEASRRVSAELARVAAQTLRFQFALGLAVALAAGLVGAATALLLLWWLPRARRRMLLVSTATALMLALAMARAFLRQPALLEPSLGGAAGAFAPWLARFAVWASPRALDAAWVAGLAAAGAAGLLERRGALSELAGAVGRYRRSAAAAACLAALLLASGVIAHARRPGAPALLVLAADSLRPDRFRPETTPHLLALAERGVSFDAALSPIARTTPAWVSILSGLYPHSHGVRDMFPRRELRPAYLPYLPRRLADAGFATSVLSDYAGDFFPTFDFGFQRARVPPPLTLPLVFEREVVTSSPLALALLNHRFGRALFPVFRFLMTNADPERLADEVLAELEASQGHQAMVVAFFSTTHVPFAAPAPWYRRFASPTYGGPHRYAYNLQQLADIARSDAELPARDVTQIRGLYDGALAAVDAAIGRILERVGEQTLVLVLSDHGENLFEPGTTTHHGKWFKGGDESNRVPLIFAGPGLPRGVRVPEPVSLVDVAPTVAKLLGLPPVPGDGRSLVPAFKGHAEERDVFAETGIWLSGPATPDSIAYPPLTELLEADPEDHFQLVLKARYEDVVVAAKHRMLRRGHTKLLYIPTRDGARYQLYDMAADPHQLHDGLAGATRGFELERAMKRFLARDPERELDERDHLVRRTEH